MFCQKIHSTLSLVWWIMFNARCLVSCHLFSLNSLHNFAPLLPNFTNIYTGRSGKYRNYSGNKADSLRKCYGLFITDRETCLPYDLRESLVATLRKVESIFIRYISLQYHQYVQILYLVVTIGDSVLSQALFAFMKVKQICMSICIHPYIRYTSGFILLKTKDLKNLYIVTQKMPNKKTVKKFP